MIQGGHKASSDILLSVWKCSGDVERMHEDLDSTTNVERKDFGAYIVSSSLR